MSSNDNRDIFSLYNFSRLTCYGSSRINRLAGKDCMKYKMVCKHICITTIYVSIIKSNTIVIIIFLTAIATSS